MGVTSRRSPAAGALASVAAVAAVTAVIWLLQRWIPVLSLGILYIFAVLPIAVVWGLHVRGRRVGREHARVQLLLPRAGAHAHADRLAQLVRARRVRRHLDRRLGARGAVTPAGARGLAARRDRDRAPRARRPSRRSSSRSRPTPPGRCTPRARRSRSATSRETATRSPRAAGAWGRSGSRAAARPTRAPAGAFCPALASLLGVAIDRERLAREAYEAEALRRADAIKTALLRSVSHDLRTPLMAISTSAGALASPELAIDEADRDELLATILSASDRLDHLVGNLLDLSRCRPVPPSPQRALVELDEIVVGALDELGADGRADRGVAPGRSARRLGRRTPDPARPREPDRERAEVLARRGAHPRPGRRDRVGGADPGDRPRARASPPRRVRPDLRAVPARRPLRRVAGRRARARDRARVRRGERRAPHRRVTPGPGRGLRALRSPGSTRGTPVGTT